MKKAIYAVDRSLDIATMDDAFMIMIELCGIMAISISVFAILKHIIFPHISDIDYAIRVNFVYKVQRLVMDKKWRKMALDGIVFDAYTGNNSTDEAKGSGCTICLSDYQEGERRATITACSHRFHDACLFAWMKQRYSCPLCRLDLV